MVNNPPYPQRLGYCILTALLLLAPASSRGEPATLGDFTELQQDIRWLKSTIEYLKLQRQLEQLRPEAGTTQKICQPGSGLGSLTLSTLYSAHQQYYATFHYNQHTPVVARQGEVLLCGETVLKITLEGVELEKQGQRYQLAGQVATLLPANPSLSAAPGKLHAP